MREDLVKSAIIGTKHYASQLSAKELLCHIVEGQLTQQAGYIPTSTIADLPKRALQDETRLCGEELIQQFGKICKHRDLDTVRLVWIEKFSQAGWQLPNEFMPAMVEGRWYIFEGLNYRTLEQLFGKRLEWYIKVSGNENWPEDTETNPILEFTKKRETIPDEARTWLIENWDILDHIQQQNYLSAMDTNLSERDIPFLTQIFWSNTIQERPLIYKAAVFLSLLGAEIIQPLIEEVLELTHFQVFSKQQVPVLDFQWSDMFSDLPIYRNDDMSKNIVGWISKLTQLISLVPLDHWYQYWQLESEALLEAAYNGAHADIFFTAWKARIIYEKNQDFAPILIDFVKTRHFLEVKLVQESLLKVLSFEQLQTYVEKQLQNNEEK